MCTISFSQGLPHCDVAVDIYIYIYVCSSDVHHLEQKPVSATEMQFTHATRSPRASQIAERVVCGSKVDIVAGISARDSFAMKKSFLQLVFEVL